MPWLVKPGIAREGKILEESAALEDTMTFLSRDLLWMLLGVPLLVGTYVLLLGRRSAVLICTDLSLVRVAAARTARWRRHIPASLLLLALVALLLASARPAAVMTMLAAQRTVVLAIDVSLSMSATDVEPSRLAAAQAAAKRFIHAQPSDVKIGIVSFAGTAEVVESPTANRARLDQAIDRLKLDYHTAVGSGILAALLTIFPTADIGGNYDIFGGATSASMRQVSFVRPHDAPVHQPVAAGSYTSAAIVLLTDGSRTMGPDPLAAARVAADRGVRIFTVGVGAVQRAKVAVDGWSMEVGFDEPSLKSVAAITGGEYFQASSADGLDRVYRDLSTRFVVERKEVELAAIFTAAAAVLSLLAVTLSILWCRRVS
jgi:Ca-activated chloride channel family protein